MISAEIAALLRCPHCGGALAGRDCASCGTSFPMSSHGQLDLRPRSLLTRSVAFAVEPSDPLWSSDRFEDYRDVETRPLHFAALIPRAPAGGGYALEIGVGNRALRAEVEGAGWTFVGVDYRNAGADLLIDVHALPFAPGSISLVVCSALLEHVRYPHLAMQEIARVTAGGGTVIGEVAFLQPFHTSYFHMTHAAVRDALRGAGLELTTMGRSPERFLPHLARHSLLPRWATLLMQALVMPADGVHTLLMKLRRVVKKRRHDGSLGVAVAVVFAATKPVECARFDDDRRA